LLGNLKYFKDEQKYKNKYSEIRISQVLHVSHVNIWLRSMVEKLVEKHGREAWLRIMVEEHG
jgi:hypothetical protein